MKRKISLMLAAIMTVTSMAISSITSMAAETATFTDVTSETKYSEAILTLAKLGVVQGNEGMFKPNDGITRAEVVAIITRAMNIADYATGVSTFTDVPEGHWATKNIIAATSRGIVNGYGDGLFGPSDNVTYEQVMKMLVCAMNYGNAAEALGGWPNGYFNKGTDLGLNTGVDSSVLREAPAPRGVVAQLMFNALDIEVADPKTSIATDETFLNEFLGMDMVTGTLVGVEEDVTAECDEELARDEMAVLPKGEDLIRIDFEGVEEAEDLVKFLGKEVFVFYKMATAGGMNTLVILDTEVTENEETEIKYDDIISYNGGSINYYNESGKRKSIEFDIDDVTVYYNKKAVTSRVEDKLDEWLDPNEDDFIYGTVTLIDSGSDGKIDMVEILDYEYMVALRAPSSSDYTVTNKMKFKNKDNAERILDAVTLNPDKNAYSFIITDQNGVKLETTGIKANSVVMVATSEEEDYYTVSVSTKTVDGEIDGFSTSDNTIQIDGKEYIMTNDCLTYLEEQGTELKNGSKGKFYLDTFGNIAYATLNVSTESTTTVYLIVAVYDEDTESGSLRVFVPGSGYKTYPLDDKVKLDGETSTPEEAIYYLRDNSENFKDEDLYNIERESNANQLIKIELNGNTVKEIYTVDASKNGTTNETAGLKLYLEEPMKFKYNANTFTSTDGSTKFFSNSSTIFIYVPKDRTETASYQKKTTSYFEKTGTYTIEAYNVNDSKMAEVVVIYGTGDGNKVSGATPISVVASAPGNKVSGDEVLKELKFYTNNDTLVSKVVDEDEDVDDLVAGDIFRYVSTNEGFVGDVRLKISYEDILEVLEKGEYDWNASKFSFETSYKRTDGTGLPYVTASVYNVAGVTEEGILVTKDGFEDGELPEDADTIFVEVNDSTKILKMSEDGDELLSVDEESEEALTIDDLLSAEYDDDKCSKVAVITYNSDSAKLIVIYE